MNRVFTVTRMQFVNKYTFVWLPLLILVVSLVLSIAIFALIPYGGRSTAAEARLRSGISSAWASCR